MYLYTIEDTLLHEALWQSSNIVRIVLLCNYWWPGFDSGGAHYIEVKSVQYNSLKLTNEW